MSFGPDHWHKYDYDDIKTKHFYNNTYLSGMAHDKLNDPTTPVINVSAFHIQRKCYKEQSRRPEY